MRLWKRFVSGQIVVERESVRKCLITNSPLHIRNKSVAKDMLILEVIVIGVLGTFLNESGEVVEVFSKNGDRLLMEGRHCRGSNQIVK
jgi:hypothetical protein